MLQDKVTLNSEEIKPLALAIIKASVCEAVSQSVKEEILNHQFGRVDIFGLDYAYNQYCLQNNLEQP